MYVIIIFIGLLFISNIGRRFWLQR